MQDLRVAYVTSYDPDDVHAWSGCGVYIRKSLESAGCRISTIGNLKIPLQIKPLLKAKSILYGRIQNKTYHFDRERAVLRSYAAQVNRALRSVEHDVVFSPSTLPIAFIETKKPVVFWTDATFAGLIDFYPEFQNLCADTRASGNFAEQSALSRCHLAFYSSDWAVQTALQHYAVAAEKLKVLPFGANIECSRTSDDVLQFLAQKRGRVCKLLFAGVAWQRKGGDVAVRAAELLNDRGIKTELHVVGCAAPDPVPEWVIQHGFVSKKTESGHRKLAQLFSQSHFLILPTRAECFGVVCAEASSFGLPTLTGRVGGMQTTITEGRNGFTISHAEGAQKYCEHIERLWASREAYEDLSLSSFAEFTSRLNWNASGLLAADWMQQACAKAA
jgi:glycosyltransferase involved in cell wall biosynthesis